MKRYNKFIFILFVTAILSGIATSLEAQDKPKKKKTALIEVKGLVTDNTGKPLSGVTVLSGEGSIINYTDANGKFALKTKADGTLLIEAFGYKDVVINLAKEQPTVIKLQNEDLYASERDIHERADGGKTYQRDLVSTVSKLSMENVLKYPDLQLSNALQGQAAGLIAISGDGGMQMNIQEFATAVLEELPLILCVFNNTYLGMVRQWQKLFYGKRYSMTDLRAGAATRRGEEHPPKYTPDFVKLAESYGAKGIRVTEKSEMKAAFEQAKANRALKVPTLIEFMLDPEVQVYPMVRPGGTLEDLLMD